MMALYKVEPEQKQRDFVGGYPDDLIHEVAAQAGLEAYEIQSVPTDSSAPTDESVA